MIAHITLPVSDYPSAKAFYGKVLATLGYRNNMDPSREPQPNTARDTAP
jgi:catechol 2,3-dioxygenase-like lactoylglutathione lyase family enzyme